MWAAIFYAVTISGPSTPDDIEVLQRPRPSAEERAVGVCRDSMHGVTRDPGSDFASRWFWVGASRSTSRRRERGWGLRPTLTPTRRRSIRPPPGSVKGASRHSVVAFGRPLTLPLQPALVLRYGFGGSLCAAADKRTTSTSEL